MVANGIYQMRQPLRQVACPLTNISFESKLSFSRCNENDEFGWKTFAIVETTNLQKQKYEIENAVVH